MSKPSITAARPPRRSMDGPVRSVRQQAVVTIARIEVGKFSSFAGDCRDALKLNTPAMPIVRHDRSPKQLQADGRTGVLERTGR